MYMYPAYIHEDDDGTASGFFPGIPGCYFAGDTVEECLSDARTALDAHLELIVDGGENLPLPKSAKECWHDEDCRDGAWVLVDIDETKFEGGAVRFNATLPNLLLKKIDKAVESDSKKFGSRSGFLALAARSLLAHH